MLAVKNSTNFHRASSPRSATSGLAFARVGGEIRRGLADLGDARMT
jgi:hypothetical protein